MTEGEIDVDERGSVPLSELSHRTKQLSTALLDASKTRMSREQSTFDESFHSVKEELAREPSKEATDAATHKDSSPKAPKRQIDTPIMENNISPSPQQEKPSKHTTVENENEIAEKEYVLDEEAVDDSLRSASAGSSPATKGLVRKSSLTFATLPARAPLTTKKSIGARISRESHVEASKGIMSRGSFLGKITGDKSLGGSRPPEVEVEILDNGPMDLEADQRPLVAREESDGEAKATRLHNKSSTQRLHDRINMLGKSQPARPTKSIPATATLAQPPYPDLPIDLAPQNNGEHSSNGNEEEDDWIKPPPTRAIDSPRPMLSKSISADVMENLRGKVNISDREFGNNNHEIKPSPRRHSLPRHSESGSTSATIPSEPAQTSQGTRSTTPIGTPASNRYADGPLSASKSKLQSIMKTARGLFTSSAGASAQAKMELRNQAQVDSPLNSLPNKDLNVQHDTCLYPSLQTDDKILSSFVDPPVNPAKPVEGRRTRGSIEKEKKERERQQANDGAEKLAKTTAFETQISAREPAIETQDHRLQVNRFDGLDEPATVNSERIARQSPEQMGKSQEAITVLKATEEDTAENATTTNNQPPPSSNQSQSQRPNAKRPIKPAKEAAPKPEPQRVAIRVGTLSQRIPLTNAALSSGLQDSLPPPPNKRPGLSKNASTASVQTAASNNSLRNAASSKPKALIAAERKKEQVSDFEALLLVRISKVRLLTCCRMKRRFNENLSRRRISNVKERLNKKKLADRSRRSVTRPKDSANGIVQLLPTIPKR